jgi:hypothetical protein
MQPFFMKAGKYIFSIEPLARLVFPYWDMPRVSMGCILTKDSTNQCMFPGNLSKELIHLIRISLNLLEFMSLVEADLEVAKTPV